MTDPICLADWLELTALTAADGSASGGDLERALRRTGAYQQVGDEAVEEKVGETLDELKDRARATGEGYPFVLENVVIRTRGRWRRTSVYVFCLCLSYVGFKKEKNRKAFPERIFEHLSCSAAANYVDGDAVRFGFPRDTMPRRFADAITRLTKLLCEGRGYRKGALRAGMDRALDVVAWKHFYDRKSGKLLLFGQCAAGADWTSKLPELQPGAFCAEFMNELPTSPIMKAFFIPHRVEPSEWSWYSRNGGIIFDRCRIAAWQTSPTEQRGTGAEGPTKDGISWSESVLKALKA